MLAIWYPFASSVVIAGAVFLFASAFTPKFRRASGWMRAMFCLAGVTAVPRSVLGFLLLFY